MKYIRSTVFLIHGVFFLLKEVRNVAIYNSLAQDLVPKYGAGSIEIIDYFRDSYYLFIFPENTGFVHFKRIIMKK